MANVKVAVVGLGIGMQHCHGLQLVDNCELTYVVDLNEEKAKEVAEHFGCKYATTMSEVLGQVDAVCICTPHHLHGPQSLEAIRAGKHVLLEKPLANTKEECLAVTQAAEERGVTLMLAYVVRFSPTIERLKEMIETEEYGKPFHADCYVPSYLPPMPGSWFSKKEQLGGGTLFSHGCHYIDILQWMMGKPVEVAELGTRNGTEWMEGEGSSHSVMKFESGALGHLFISWGMKYKNFPFRFQFHTPSACITVDNSLNKIEVVTEDGTKTVFENPTPKGPGLAVAWELKHFVECIRNNVRPSVDGYEGLLSHQIIWDMESHPGKKVVL
jgi:predicted dehydrogenase